MAIEEENFIGRRLEEVELDESGDEVYSRSLFYVEDELERSNISTDSIMEEVEDRSNSYLYFSPRAFSLVLERETGKHQAHLYDVPEDERPATPEPPEIVEEGLDKVVEMFSGSSIEGRVDVKTYEREGDPQYLRTHEGYVSEQVFEMFWKSLPASLEVGLEQTEEGYIMEF